jgi:Flp pilus assembly protein TadG
MKRLLLKAPIMRFVELARCRRGVVAVEFALIIPFLVTLLYGTAELGNIYMLDRKINRSAQIGADLVAQVETVSTSDLEDVMDAMDQIVSPFGTTTRKIKVSQIYYDPVDDQIEIDWSVARNDTPLTGGDVYTLPGNLVASGESVIIVSYEYTYTPTYATFLGSFTIVDEAYLRPRLTTRVEKT